ncbi:hypothetical protein AK88_05540 [Plasmodium fragile]|uniref:Schizont-infected cell agglutination extracellular alpha domain-containing protein n=1 Tax=Plasmodium fragile TaxID=5857 RepID=A0A0D9QCU2_PLAFR|nr:uncharacterized protein AK88_05540 [Plasmodium fragile]KJP84828.1 hypothetical protein AK88_05540 [Plasmodium fragile]
MADDDKLWGSKEGKNFISNLRVQWAQRNGSAGDDQQTKINKEMWDKMQELKKQIAKNMKGDKDEDDGIPEILCGAEEENDGAKLEGKEKKMCALLVRLMFYIEGLNGEGTLIDNDGTNDSMKPLEDGMKCIIGSVYIQKIMQLACWDKDILDHALQAGKAHVNEMLKGRPSRSRQCVKWQFGDTCVGDFPLEGRITTWMLDDSSVTDRVKNASRDSSCAVQDWTSRIQDMRQKAQTRIRATACAGSPRNVQLNAKTGQGEQGRPTPPAAAKPNKPATAAKPVAARPASSGGRGGGKAGSGAGPKEGVHTDKPGECQGDRLAEWKHPTVHVVPQYNKGELERLRDVFDDFKKYMDTYKDQEHAYGANCYNTGWDDITRAEHYFEDQKVADVVRCRVMTLALGWANGWNNSKQDKHKQHKNQTEKEMEERLRCEVVNVFGHLLRHRYCPHQQHWRRGTEYPWIVFKNMKSAGTNGIGQIDGPVVEGKCTMCGYGHNRQHVDAVNLDLVQWFLQHGNIWDGMQNIDERQFCNTKWAVYTKDNMKEYDTTRVDEEKINDIKEVEKNVVDAATRVIEKAKVAVEQEIEQQKGNNTGSTEYAYKGGGKYVPTISINGRYRTKGTCRSSRCTVSRICTIITRQVRSRVSSTAFRSRIATTTPTVGTTEQCSENEMDQDKLYACLEGTVTPDIPPQVTDPEEENALNKTLWGSSRTISVTEGSTPITFTVPTGTEAGDKTETTDQKKTAAAPDQKDQQEPSNAQVPTHGKATSSEGHDRTGPTADIDKPWGAPVHPQTPAPDCFSGITDATCIAKDGSYSRPHDNVGTRVPGLSSPGSTGNTLGSPSTPSTATDGKDKRTAGTYDYGGPHIPFNFITDKGNLEGSYGPGTPQVPSTPQNTNIPSGPDIPDLTDTVLTATTPILFFFTAVIVAFLGYSLWKLHLAVLNECEATEWENVKEDYWQILVEEFAKDLMRDLMREHDKHNNILGVSTPDQALSGNNVASTVDPSTDSDATDSCPPNEEDPDPWCCMEAIQLATGPCRPHDPDPCKCMETIQFATEPCPPNEHDPDPWSSMENIQLATDASPPNEDNPDPWKCMEHIDLDAEQNAHSNPGDATSYCTKWTPWIDRHKHLLQDCTTQPWFLQLKADWKQYLREHMVANEDNGHRELGDAATPPMKKLRLWKQWVARQHALMHIYGEEEWFQHLLHNAQQETVMAKGAIPVVDKHLEVEKVMAADDLLRVRDLPRSQLHPQPYMKKPLTAKIWILVLASVIEECEIERSVQEKELYLDDLLQKLCN